MIEMTMVIVLMMMIMMMMMVDQWSAFIIGDIDVEETGMLY